MLSFLLAPLYIFWNLQLNLGTSLSSLLFSLYSKLRGVSNSEGEGGS